MGERSRLSQRLCNGKRGSLLDWVSALGLAVVLVALFGKVVQKSWQENGIPGWMLAYEKWEKRTLYEWGFRR